MKMSVALVEDNGDGTGRLTKAASGPESMVLAKLAEPAWQGGVVIDVAEGLAIEEYFVPDMTDPSTLEKKPPPSSASEPPVPAQVTALQFIMACEELGHINETEAEAWVSKNALPAAVLTVIGELPQAKQSQARLRALGMTVADRNAEMIAVALTALGLEEADRDDLFRLAATL